jgi:glycosyltransferase involved in cell wall biosynthesis
VVTNQTGDLAAIVVAEAIGAVTPAMPDAYAAATAALLAAPHTRAEMGRRARRVAETTLAWRTLAATVAALYGALLDAAKLGNKTGGGRASAADSFR